MLNEILKYNKEFVEKKVYEKYVSTKFPNKKVAVVSCMDTRLVELLPAALGMKNGDIKLIKNAGGVISHPYGSVMRSLLIGIYELEIEEILVIGHTDCGAQLTSGELIIYHMKERGITDDKLKGVKDEGVDVVSWLNGFYDLEKSISSSVNIIKNHSLLPQNINIYGLIIDSKTGKLTKIC